jgi:hypothetical protein
MQKAATAPFLSRFRIASKKASKKYLHSFFGSGMKTVKGNFMDLQIRQLNLWWWRGSHRARGVRVCGE